MNRLKRITAIILVFTLSWIHVYPVLAADSTTYSNDAQSFGRSSMPDFNSMLSIDQQNNQMTIFAGGTAYEMDTEQMYPESERSTPIDYDALYGEDAEIKGQTNTIESELRSEDSFAGQAYQTMRQAAIPPPENFRDDPLWDGTKTAFGDVFSDEFNECDFVANFSSSSMTSHVPDYKTCQDVYKPEGSCIIHHDYELGFIQFTGIGDEGGFESCGTGCLDIWVGKVGDNYWSGSCSIYERDIQLTVHKPEAITSATLERVVYDDYMQIYLNNEKVWYGPNANFPPETDGACELSESRNYAVSTDLTEQFTAAGTLNFKIRVSVTGNGEGYSRIRVRFDPAKVIEGDEWLEKECVDQALSTTGDFCVGSYQCTDLPGTPCAVIGGVEVCEDDLAPSPLPGISNLCREVEVTVDNCGFNEGQMNCWTDAQGEEQCPYNEGDITTTCDELESDPSCGFIRTECVEGALDPETGLCHVYTSVYDCGESIQIETAVREDVVTCDGEVSCMGDECVQHPVENDMNFARASAALDAAQYAVQDIECEEGSVCTVFKGQPMECKKAVGGWQDCCESPVSVSLTDYITLLQATNKIASAKTWLAGTVQNPVYGHWTAVKDATSGAADTVKTQVSEYASEAWKYVKDASVKAWESIAGAAGDTAATSAATSGGTSVTSAATAETASSVVSTTIQNLSDKLATWVYDTFGQAAYNTLFTSGAGTTITQTVVQDGVATTTTTTATGTTTTAAASTAANGTTSSVSGAALGGMVGSALNVVMWAYTAYLIANLLVQIIYECETEEFELGAKRNLKVCTYLGSYCASDVLGACVEERHSYCCYTSPLSRILNEQMRAQLGMPYGDKKNPDCSGVTLEQLAQVDWSVIDLDEWVGILAQTGHLQTPTSPDLNVEGLTGAGTALDVEDPRPNALQRTERRLGGGGLSNVNNELGDMMWQQLPQ